METRTRVSTQISTKSGEADCKTSSRMAGDERRLQILREAMRLFSKRGFRGTTTKEIAQATGISEAMVFRHFATKDELYTAILDYKVCSMGVAHPEELVKEAIEKKDDRRVFKTLAFAGLEFHKNDPDFQRLLLHSALEGHQLARMFWERMVLHIYEVLGQYIEQRQRDGVFRKMNPSVVVRAFVGMIIHHSLNNNLWDREQRLLKISNEEAAHEFTEILLRGVIADESNAKADKKRSVQKTKSSAKRSKKL